MKIVSEVSTNVPKTYKQGKIQRKHRHERVVYDGATDDGEGGEGLDVIDALKGAC